MKEVKDANGTTVAILTIEAQDVTCDCGTPLVRNGITVTEHWIGNICDPCDQKKRLSRLEITR